MGTRTKIEWATHTFNPWLGCSKVSSGCQNCYAAAMAGRLGVVWGPGGTRRRTAESTWRKVEKWNRAEQPFLSWTNHERPRVFPSLCDIFEGWGGQVEIPPVGQFGAGWGLLTDVRREFFALIDRCQNLDFLLLTKRPENVRRMTPDRICGRGYVSGPTQYRNNVWLLYSASDQDSLEAGLPHLLACRDLVSVLGLSLEPLIGPVDLSNVIEQVVCAYGTTLGLERFWCIVGGESGPRHRPMEIAWLESIVDQCRDAGVPLYVKQDSGPKAGQQGRLPDHLWSLKQFPGKDAGC